MNNYPSETIHGLLQHPVCVKTHSLQSTKLLSCGGEICFAAKDRTKQNMFNKFSYAKQAAMWFNNLEINQIEVWS